MSRKSCEQNYIRYQTIFIISSSGTIKICILLEKSKNRPKIRYTFFSSAIFSHIPLNSASYNSTFMVINKNIFAVRKNPNY